MTVIRTQAGVFPTDTSTFDITVASAGTPTGVVVMVTSATVLDTNTDHGILSWGVTDFTTVGCVSVNDEDAQTTTDGRTDLQATNIINVTSPGTSTVLRSATVATTTDGVRFTPIQSGTAYRVHVILIYDTACFAFVSNGDGSLDANETFTIAHGFTTEPGAGFYGYGDVITGGISNDWRLGLGYHAYDGSISQAAASWFFRGGQGTSESNSRVAIDRCCHGLTSTGAEADGLELTAIDTTNCTYINRVVSANTSDWIGFLLECIDVSSVVTMVDSPTSSTVDWNYTSLSFQPQFVSLLTNRNVTVASDESDSDAGTGAIVTMDSVGVELSSSFSSQDAVSTSNTKSKMSQALVSLTHTGGNTHLMVNPTFTATGWDFAAADITVANSTIRRWPALSISILTDAGSPAITQVGGISNNVIYDNELRVTLTGSLFEAVQGTGIVQLHDSDPELGAPSTSVTQTIRTWSDTAIVFDVDKGAIVGDTVWIEVTADAGPDGSISITCNDDPGTGNTAVRLTPLTQTMTESVAFTLDTSLYYFNSDVQDVLTFTEAGLPTGLTINTKGLISGTIADGEDGSSPFTVDVTCTDVDANNVTDQFSWTVAAQGTTTQTTLKANSKRRGCAGILFGRR